MLLEISQNSQESTCARASFFNKIAGLRPATLLKKRLWYRCFPVNFVKFLRTPILQNTSGRLLLKFEMVVINPENSYEVKVLHSLNDSSNDKTDGDCGDVKKIYTDVLNVLNLKMF